MTGMEAQPLAYLAIAAVLVAVALIATRKKKPKQQAGALEPMEPRAWQIGPFVRGRNYSVNMPLHPSAHQDGWVIELPQPTSEAGSVHYITMPTGSLLGKRKISMSFRIEADPGVKILPRLFPDHPSMLTLYLQRAGDKWTMETEAWRWYAGFSRLLPLKPGEYRIEAPFNGNWTAVMTSSRETHPEAFQAALAGAERVGFVLGGGDGAGHGIYATGPARIVVTGFEVA